MGAPRAPSAAGVVGILCVAVVLLAGRQVHTERELAHLHDSSRRLTTSAEGDEQEGGSSGAMVTWAQLDRELARLQDDGEAAAQEVADNMEAERKTNSPQLAQQAMKIGLSPSQVVVAAMSGRGRRRVSVVGAKHQSAALDGLQSPPRSGRQQARPQKRNSLTWRRGPFATATPDSVHMDPAARRLKVALVAAFDTAAAAGTATSVGQRKKYMGEINVRNILVVLGPSNALELVLGEGGVNTIMTRRKLGT
eukprot:COSAG06_NODE_514_length_14849_cov_4.520881_7_plen_251_part_00